MCLSYLLKAIDHVDAEIIIINDGRKIELELPAEIMLFPNTKHGVAAARNLGASKAMGIILLFLDDDMLIFKENVDAIINFHSNNSGCILNLNWIYPPIIQNSILRTPFGRYLDKYGFTSLKGWNKDNPNWNDNITFQSLGITSQNLSMQKSTFSKIGGYNEAFPYAGFEDHELSDIINKAKIKIFIDPQQITYHNELDRLKPLNWLMRKYRGGITRRIAYHQGHHECQIKAGILKITVSKIIFQLFTPISVLLNFPFKFHFLDTVYFAIITKLLAVAIYRGYYSNEAKCYINKS
jgi:glycosyltransferase involved in cell wall biosynthesis